MDLQPQRKLCFVPALPGSAPWLRALALAMVLAAFSAAPAMAQIYVVIDPDGTRRFTNEPVEGSEKFLETMYTADPNANVRTGSVPFLQEISEASSREGVDAKLVEAVIAAESAFDPWAESHKGAQGLMQLMPDTANRFGVANVWDPRDNIAGGTAYLGKLIEMFSGNLHHVLAAYNAGEGAVTRHGGVPPYAETQQYVERVLAYYRSIGGENVLASRAP
jgi:soluble lytic murein transglycosylase-like protein